jgi:hypothetical protein
MTRLVLVALAALAAASLASAAGGGTHLTIDVWPGGRTVAAGHKQYTLSCAPAKGTVPHAAAACAALRTVVRPFAATPKGTVCPSLVLGPQEAHVAGTVNGVRVNAWLNLQHCGVDRWNAVKAIVPMPKLTVTPPPKPVTTPTTGLVPTITGFSPTSGPVGTSVTVTGTNLASVVGVQLGTMLTVPASGATATQLVFVVPPGATSGPIKLFTKGGAAKSTDTFTVTG